MKENNISSYVKDEQEILNGLKSYVLLRYNKEGLKTLSISSSSRGESKTWVAINLASAFAHANIKTLLIDLDLESPGVDVKLKLKNSVGITDIAGKVTTLKDAVIKYDNNFDILLSGSKIKYIEQFLNSSVLSNTVNDIAKNYDMLIINNSPITSVEDCEGIENYADSMILCVGENSISKFELKKVSSYIDESNINLLGIIMTNTSVENKVEKKEDQLKNVVFDVDEKEPEEVAPSKKEDNKKQADKKNKPINKKKVESKHKDTKATTKKETPKKKEEKKVVAKKVSKQKPAAKKVSKLTTKKTVKPETKKVEKQVKAKTEINQKDRIRAAIARQKNIK